ncbi:hypothetical protein CHLNCDRAFT_133859 [Chlorella variabilis]|uniref:SOUL heme-binding protein n=1 Tax=Chlorella variabilis TaxID=554065 RepID=E1ZFE6_CHLVA|nr:hypothetical protein CHLNCDRAFT_133859 [Chlorella variabilis]EFN55487.1 hypothetical protein CHLNCDRAFT_133859 [Chlorella variabilis]|eukprot:XP_005847589.1 hypothetical protein CHLNCDRAFT_133859 [Chlorella variabilis]
MKGPALCLVLAMCLGVGVAAQWKQPAFCKDWDCPKYEEVEKADGYETRKYEEAMWAWVQAKGDDMEESVLMSDAALAGAGGMATLQAHAELLAYFNGANKGSKTIPMGTPMAHNISRRDRKGDVAEALGRKRKEDVEVTVKMYLPYNFQEGKEEAPKPSSKNVKVDKFPEWTAHVRSFDGFPTRRKFKEHARTLMDYLEEDNKDYSDEWAVFRHNEVLFPAEASHHRRSSKAGCSSV